MFSLRSRKGWELKVLIDSHSSGPSGTNQGEGGKRNMCVNTMCRTIVILKHVAKSLPVWR